MAGDTPFRKRRFRRKGSPEVYEGGTGPAEGVQPAAEHSALSLRSGAGDDERGLPASLEADREDHGGPKTRGRRLDTVKRGVRRGGDSAKAALAHLADRIIENAPRVPVRDLATLRRQFPGLGPEELADKLVAGAANSTSTVGAGIGAAAMLPVPPAMPAELAAEITAVAAIELKLIAELHEVYGLRPPGTLRERSAAYLTSWTEERGVDITRPSTFNGALSGRMKRELRQQIMKRTVRSLPNLVPFMIGAAVGAMMNRRDTKKVAERIRKDLRARRIPWDTLPALPPLERPVELPVELPKELDR
ncbi:EcsC family protein [Streptomyces sp. 35G-GA-8]|uniref:EcsC family protein n=1 Tax=Streptomyces sp. 35G-GA-8 TaxID=2939434 RepID=UPI00201EF617|nr:EcsC family protein [Streptomyces sp. 35G-GA-8]MCL7381089.1 EcsC family protein [Streptomyces sp. 35G-GA-8]